MSVQRCYHLLDKVIIIVMYLVPVGGHTFPFFRFFLLLRGIGDNKELEEDRPSMSRLLLEFSISERAPRFLSCICRALRRSMLLRG